jgi:hypothetical protein
MGLKRNQPGLTGRAVRQSPRNAQASRFGFHATAALAKLLVDLLQRVRKLLAKPRNRLNLPNGVTALEHARSDGRKPFRERLRLLDGAWRDLPLLGKRRPLFGAGLLWGEMVSGIREGLRWSATRAALVCGDASEGTNAGTIREQ